jgi:hypothetical protein
MIKRFKEFFNKKKKVNISEFDSLLDDDFYYSFNVYYWTPKEKIDYKDGLGYPCNTKIKDEDDLINKIKNKELIFRYTNLVFSGLEDDGNTFHVESYQRLTSKLNDELCKNFGKNFGNDIESLISIWEDNGIYSSDIVIFNGNFGPFIGVEKMNSKCLGQIIKKFIK